MYKFKVDDPNGKTLGSLEAWFPKTIFRSENILSTEYLETIKTFTENLIKENSLRTNSLSVDSTHKTNNLIAYKEYDSLIQAILERITAYAESLGFCSKSQMSHLRITNMWANKSYGGDFNFPHVHPNSIFSGVFYVDAPPHAIITFYDNVYDMSIDPKEANMFSYRHTRYPCTPNSMLIFKSDFLHGNERQVPGSKIAISFNAII